MRQIASRCAQWLLQVRRRPTLGHLTDSVGWPLSQIESFAVLAPWARRQRPGALEPADRGSTRSRRHVGTAAIGKAGGALDRNARPAFATKLCNRAECRGTMTTDKLAARACLGANAANDVTDMRVFEGRGFSERTIKALLGAGVDMPERLLLMPEKQFVCLVGVGKAAADEIRAYRRKLTPSEDSASDIRPKARRPDYRSG